MRQVIYAIKLPNKSWYVGATKNLRNRINTHQTNQTNPHIRETIDKYGWDSHEVFILEDCSHLSRHGLELRETFWFQILRDDFKCNMVNEKVPGEDGKLSQPSERYRRLMSEVQIGIQAGDKNPMYGKRGKDSPTYGTKPSLETRKKISEAKKGVLRGPLSKETRRKMSESKIGENNPNYGKKRSLETRKKISEALRKKFKGNVKQKITTF